MKKIFLLTILLLFQPPAFAGGLSFDEFIELTQGFIQQASDIVSKIVKSKDFQGAVIGTGVTMAADNVIRNIYRKMNNQEEADQEEEEQPPVPPTSTTSIILSAAYGAYLMEKNIPWEEKAIIAAEVSVALGILFLAWSIGVEAGEEDESKKLGLSKNILNFFKQTALNFLSCMTGEEATELLLMSGQGPEPTHCYHTLDSSY